MRQKNWRTKLGILLAALLFTAGCVAMMLMGLGGAAAIGSYKWLEGTMEKDYPTVHAGDLERHPEGLQ